MSQAIAQYERLSLHYMQESRQGDCRCHNRLSFSIPTNQNSPRTHEHPLSKIRAERFHEILHPDPATCVWISECAVMPKKKSEPAELIGWKEIPTFWASRSP
jgi:hypothetical protein